MGSSLTKTNHLGDPAFMKTPNGRQQQELAKKIKKMVRVPCMSLTGSSGTFGEVHQKLHHFQDTFKGVSINGGTPKWMVFVRDRKPPFNPQKVISHKQDDCLRYSKKYFYTIPNALDMV